MSKDISSGVARGINEGEFTYQQAQEACTRLQDGTYQEGKAIETIFDDLDEDTTVAQDEFVDMLAAAKHTSAENVSSSDAEIFFSILDTNGNGILSYDELSMLSYDGSTITDFDLWKILDNFSDKSVKLASGKYSSIDFSSKNDDKDKSILSAIEDIYGKDSTEYKDALEAIEEGDEITLERQELDSEKMQEIATKIVDGKADLSDYEDLLTEDAYKALESAVADLKAKAEEKSDGEEDDDSSVDKTDKNSSASSGSGTENVTQAEKKSELHEDALELGADEINDTVAGIGSDMSKLEDILSDPNYSADDIVAIIDAWEEKYGKDGAHLMELIEDQCANSDDVQKIIAQKLTEAAIGGNEAAVEMIAIQMKSATSEDAGTSDAFLAELFKTFEDNPDLLLSVCDEYQGGYSQMIEDIEKDHKKGLLSWMGVGKVNETGQGYVDIIKDAVRNRKK